MANWWSLGSRVESAEVPRLRSHDRVTTLWLPAFYTQVVVLSTGRGFSGISVLEASSPHLSLFLSHHCFYYFLQYLLNQKARVKMAMEILFLLLQQSKLRKPLNIARYLLHMSRNWLKLLKMRTQLTLNRQCPEVGDHDGDAG